MKVFINEKNEMIQKVCENKKLTNVQFHYYLSHNKIYKEIVKNKEIIMFKYNKTNGRFDIPLSVIDNIDFNEDFDKITRLQFYSEVLNIIKRRSVLGYMINEYKKLKLDFKDLYISEMTHKSELAKLISSDKKTNFTKIDTAILIENICQSTKIPYIFKKEIRTALLSTFYRKELEYKKMIELVNKIIAKELRKKLPEFTDKEIWDFEYQKMMQTRKDILALYNTKTR